MARKQLGIDVIAKAASASKNFDEFKASIDKARKACEAADGSLGSLDRKLKRAEQTMDGAKKGIDRFRNVLGAAGLVAVAAGAVVALDRVIDRSLKLQNVQAAATISIDRAQRATKGLVSNYDLQVAATQAVRLGVVKTEKDFARLAQTAVRLGLSVGKGATESINDLVSGLGRGETEILDNLGVMLKANQAYEEYAATLGKAASELTETEKKQAIITVGQEKAAEMAEKLEIRIDDGTQAWIKHKNELKNLGDTVLPVVTAGLGYAAGALNDLLGITDARTERDIVNVMTDLEKATKSAFENTANLTDDELVRLDRLEAEMIGLNATYQQGEVGALKYTVALRSLLDRMNELADKAREVNIPIGPDFGPSPEVAAMIVAQHKQRAKRRRGRDPLEKTVGGIGTVGLTKHHEAEFLESLGGPTGAITGGTLDPFSEENLQAQEQYLRRRNELDLQFELERIAAREQAGVLDPVTAIQMEQAAQLEHLDFLAQYAEDSLAQDELRLERERVNHDARLRMDEAERRSKLESLRVFQTVNASIGASTSILTNSMRLGAEALAKNEEEKTRVLATAAAIDAGIQAAIETARAIQSYATYNIPAGLMHTAAAISFTAAAVVAGKEAAGAGGGAPGLGGAQFAPGFAANGPANQPASRAGAGPSIPRSIPSTGDLDRQAAASPTARGGGGPTTVVHIKEFRTIGKVDEEETAMALGRALKRAEGGVGRF